MCSWARSASNHPIYTLQTSLLLQQGRQAYFFSHLSFSGDRLDGLELSKCTAGGGVCAQGSPHLRDTFCWKDSKTGLSLG